MNKEYIIPDIILEPVNDTYFFEFVIPNKLYTILDYKKIKGIANYLNQISIEVIMTLNIESLHLSEIYQDRIKIVEQLILMVKKRQFTYSEEDTSTWIDNFISIDYKGEKILFSHETLEGELLHGLYNSLFILEQEIKKEGSLFVVIVN